jgi:O-antigen ligase
MTTGAPTPARHAGDLATEAGWPERLRRICLYLFAVLPLMLLFSREGSEGIVAIIGLSFLAVIFVRRRWDVLAQPLVAVSIAIWIYLVAVNTTLAWWDPSAVLGRTVPWLRFFCLFGAVVFWLFADEKDFRKVAIAWGATFAFVVIDGTVQGLTGTSLTGRDIYLEQRLTGPLKRPNIGRYLAVLFYPGLVAFLLFFGEKNLDWRRIAALFATLAIVAFFIAYTGERSAVVMSLSTVTLASLVLMVEGRRFILPGLLAVIITWGIAVVTVLFTVRLRMRIDPTAEIVGDFWDSPYGELIRAAVAVWKVQPAVGVGLGNFDMVCEAWEPELIYGCLRHPHNIFLEWLAEGGAIGLAGFLAFFGVVVAAALGTLRVRRQRPLLTALVIACPVVTFIPFVPSQSFFSNWPALVWWTSLSMTCAAAVHVRRRWRG